MSSRNELVQLALEASTGLPTKRRAAVLLAAAEIIGDEREARAIRRVAACLEEADRMQEDITRAFIFSNKQP